MSVRRLHDADPSVRKSVALPNAANTTSTAAIDLGATPFEVSRGLTVQISTTSGVGANNLNLNIRLMHSDEASANFVNVAELPNPLLQINEGASVYAATEFEVALPVNIKRYLKAAVLGEANGGDASNGTLTLQLNY